MKTIASITIAAIVVVTAWTLRSNRADATAATVVSTPPAAEQPLPAPTTTVSDNAQVFQRAFWRRIAEDDTVLQAERHEWEDAEKEVKNWQWFIAVRPGTGLTDWLRKQNAFSTRPATGALNFAAVEKKPDWFPLDSRPEDFDIQQTAGGEMTLLFSRHENLLYATGAGRGFARAVQ